jgi:hypothetical protein
MTPLTADDRFAISEIVARFCYASDFADYETLATLYTENPKMEIVGVGNFDGMEWQVRHARDSEQWTNGKNRHVITNLWIEPEGDGAVAHYFLLNLMAGTNVGEAQLVTTGRFDDHVVRTPRGWRIAARRFMPDQVFAMPESG